MTISQQVEDCPTWRAVLFDCFLLLVCLVSIYSLTYSGTFQVDDEHLLSSRAQSLALRGILDFPQVFGNARLTSLSLVSHEDATPLEAIEPLQAWIGSVLYRTARMLGWGGIQTFFLSNVYVTALTGVVVYLVILQLAYPRHIARSCAWLYGLGSMAWPYSKRLFRDPLAAFFVALTFLGWMLIAGKTRRRRLVGAFLMASGILAAALSKSNSLVLLPAFLGSILAVYWTNRRTLDARKLLAGTLILVGLVVIALLALGRSTGPFARFALSHYLDLAHRYIKNLDISTLIAALGPFFSPAKSIFLFSPILALGVWGFIIEHRRLRGFALPAGLMILLLAFAQALHLGTMWAGSLYWGLRFMLPALPLLAVASAPVIRRILEGEDRLQKVLLGMLAGFSLLVQVAGASVAWYVPYVEWQVRGLDPYALPAVWKLDYLAIPYHVRALFDVSSWDVAWLRVGRHEPIAFMIPVTVLLLLVVFAYVWNTWRRMGRISRRQILLIMFVGALALAQPAIIGMPLLRSDPGAGGGHDEINACLRWVQPELRDGDLVVIDAYGTPLWHAMMNQWSADTPWVSLPPAGSGVHSTVGSGGEGLPEQVLALLEGRVVGWDRIVYIARGTKQQTSDTPAWRWLSDNSDYQGGAVCIGELSVRVGLFQ